MEEDGLRPISLVESLDGKFFPILPKAGRIPVWVEVVNSLLSRPLDEDMNSRSPAGILQINRNTGINRTFLICFGHAWQRLDDRWLEPDFGLRVALNSIPKENVVEIRAEQFFARRHLSSERAPYASSVDEFGVDFDRDLVAVVEGEPLLCPTFGSILRGGTSLRISLDASLLTLGDILDNCLARFQSLEYTKDWPDVDKIALVRDKDIICRLDDHLKSDIASVEARSKITLFTPTQRRGDSILADSYVYGRLSKSPVISPYLTITGWIDYITRKQIAPSVEAARHTPVHVLDESGAESHSCTVYDCIGYEYSDNRTTYVLSSGIWYEVVSDYVAKINNVVSAISHPDRQLPAWNRIEREGQYNARCVQENGLVNCDAENIHYGGSGSQFEFCDVLDVQSKTLYFAKIAAKSSGMSHLLEQVRRTAHLFFSTDSTYRSKLRNHFDGHHLMADLTWLDSRPKQGDWELCMVSLGRNKDDLPFFAKCGLAKLYKDLIEQGHKVTFIGV